MILTFLSKLSPPQLKSVRNSYNTIICDFVIKKSSLHKTEDFCVVNKRYINVYFFPYSCPLLPYLGHEATKQRDMNYNKTARFQLDRSQRQVQGSSCPLYNEVTFKATNDRFIQWLCHQETISSRETKKASTCQHWRVDGGVNGRGALYVKVSRLGIKDKFLQITGQDINWQKCYKH